MLGIMSFACNAFLFRKGVFMKKMLGIFMMLAIILMFSANFVYGSLLDDVFSKGSAFGNR